MDTQKLKNFLVRHRVYVNRFVIVLIAVLLAHPRNRFFFSLGFLAGFLGALLRVWAKGTRAAGSGDLQVLGPYRFVRHPSYLGAFLIYLFGPIFLHAWVTTIAGSIVLLIAFLRRIRHEEALLRFSLGRDYETYCKEVHALIPGVY